VYRVPCTVYCVPCTVMYCTLYCTVMWVPHASVNVPFVAGVVMEMGTNVTLVCDFSDYTCRLYKVHSTQYTVQYVTLVWDFGDGSASAVVGKLRTGRYTTRFTSSTVSIGLVVSALGIRPRGPGFDSRVVPLASSLGQVVYSRCLCSFSAPRN